MAGFAISDLKIDGTSLGTMSSYTFNAIASNHTIAATFVKSQTGVVVTAINCGGSTFKDTYGISYKADIYSNGGGAVKTTAPVADTVDDVLYQSYRHGYVFGYAIPVPNGTYTLKLRFAELSVTAAGQRIFNVSVQGTKVLSNLDLFSRAGLNRAFVVALPVTVSNGMLKVNFTGVVNRALINAIVLTK